MKKLALLLTLLCSIFLFSQNFYDMKWKLVAENYQKGLYKSNLPIILEIQKQATKDGNGVELIRSLKAEFTIINQTQNDDKNNITSQFFNKISTVEESLKGEDQFILKVLKANFIQDYFQNNYWRINQRTNINNGEISQIETWSKLDFKNYLQKFYQDLNQKKSELRQIKMAKYDKIFTEKESISYFPTLLDWVSSNEIDFLQDTKLFTPNERTVNQSKIENIYDELFANNSGNSKLYFQHQKINSVCNFNNCKDRLQQLEKLVKDKSTDGDYKILIIEDIVNVLVEKEDYNLALNGIKSAKEMYPKSQFLNNVINQENQIKNPSLTIHYEKNTLPNQPIHLEVNAKNTKSFSLIIYEVKDDFQNFLNYTRNSYDKNKFVLIKKSLVRKENYVLPEFFDFKNHQTAVEIKSLPAGIYVAEYKIEGKNVDDYYFLVSDSRIITEINNEQNKNPNVMKLVNRNSGNAISNQNLVFHKYNNQNLPTKYSVKTDEKGNFVYPKLSDKEYYNYFLVQQASSNNFQIIDFYNRNYYGDNENDRKNVNKAQIFTDRSIYRPGQLVYFKVINTQLIGDQESVKANLPQEIILMDSNGEEISKQKFTTNEFGSYNGSFTLPKGKLNGQFSLRAENGDYDGYKSFSVEEYKRPKFEVEFLPIKEEYKYGQTIKLKGTAKMFSGVALSNSTVNYEIKKQDIRYQYYSWYPRNYENENSILGEVKTDENGEFTIEIKLEKDEKLEGIQVDNYQINASVTDITGETQSAETNIKVASVSHYITIKNNEKENYFANENIKLEVETKNYNEQILNKNFHAKLSKLKPDERIFRSNFENEIQDAPIFSKQEFIQKFTHDYFSKEEKREKIEKEIFDKIQEPKSNNQEDKNLELGKLSPGKYQLDLYNIEGKDTIKTQKIFEVFDKRFLVDSQKPFLKVVSEKTEFNRNETGKIFIYSAIPDALVNIFVQNGNGETKTEQRKLKNGILQYEVKFPKDENVNQLNVQIQLVAYNDVKTDTVLLKIADEEKPLRIETVVFRDKLEPGKNEKWTIKILGNVSTELTTRNEKVQAEVLANMYDQSLDQFASNTFAWQKLKNNLSKFFDYNITERLSQEIYQKRLDYIPSVRVTFPNFRWNDYSFFNNLVKSYFENIEATMFLDSLQGESPGLIINSTSGSPGSSKIDVIIRGKSSLEEKVFLGYSRTATKSKDVTGSTTMSDKSEIDALIDIGLPDLSKIKVRENLNETAFFYPNLVTDKDGNVNFEFTSPEALTQWKVMFLAHTKDARTAYLEKEVVTQKEFSVTPNYPRFLREGDELQLQSKLSSLVDKPLNGTAQLQILDAFTNEDISSKFNLSDIQKLFNLKENGNSVVNWNMKVPKDVSSIIIKVVATSTSLSDQISFSDGEQKAIAVLPNRMLVTDAVPIFVKEGQTKTFSIENLVKNNSTTVQNFSNTLELTTNPIWEIMFALPSLKTDENASSDVVFNKWFADVIASEIFKANPKLKTIFEEYQSKGLINSNLEKNQELKQLLLEETPWVLESENEEEQMQKLARLFEVNSMKNSIQNDWKELQQLQNEDGGFSWYKGYQSSYYNSLYILKNLGKLNVWLKGNTADYQNAEQKQIVAKLINYVDNEVSRNWDTSTSLSAGTKENVWNNWTLDYLDSRRYWEKEYTLKGNGKILKDLVIKKSATAKLTDFTFFGLHRAALLFNSYGMTNLSTKLLTYLKETSTDTENQGVYWKQNLNDWGWYSSKTVNHAGAIEAFQQLTPNDIQFIEEMKIWLITQKEVNSWGSSRATAEVIFTILNSGKSWTSTDSDKATIIWAGKELVNPDTKATGYVKSTIKTNVLNKDLGTVTITKPGAGILQGGLFWQYYEDMDKIKSSESYISITKELYKKVKTVNGEELQKISENSPLKIGDKVTVRMILNTDRSMEFIHLKDMRAAGFEPVNVISGYEWKNNLGYYQSTKDASTNFYIQYMPKGKYVFEYDYICNAAGKFSNGITTLQNYYAPEMNAHTKGTRVEIKE